MLGLMLTLMLTETLGDKLGLIDRLIDGDKLMDIEGETEGLRL